MGWGARWRFSPRARGLVRRRCGIGPRAQAWADGRRRFSSRARCRHGSAAVLRRGRSYASDVLSFLAEGAVGRMEALPFLAEGDGTNGSRCTLDGIWQRCGGGQRALGEKRERRQGGSCALDEFLRRRRRAPHPSERFRGSGDGARPRAPDPPQQYHVPSRPPRIPAAHTHSPATRCKFRANKRQITVR